MTDEFARFHPMVNLIFYIAVLVISMIQMQVGLMVISFLGSLAYHLYLKKARGLKYLLIVGIIFITSAIINHTLELTVLAEYVETEELREILHEIGCDCYQGYLYSPAVFLDEQK